MTHHDTLLARYIYRYDRKARRLCAVEATQLYRTTYTTQLELWELDDEQWRKITPRPNERHAPPTDTGAWQLVLPVVSLMAALVAAFVEGGP